MNSFLISISFRPKNIGFSAFSNMYSVSKILEVPNRRHKSDNCRTSKNIYKSERTCWIFVCFRVLEIFHSLTFSRFTENSAALIKPKLTAAERKIINLGIDGLPSENLRQDYKRHLQDFFIWHASENRPELNKALINRYVKLLRASKLSSSTIDRKLSAIRKLATEAEDNDLKDLSFARLIKAAT